MLKSALCLFVLALIGSAAFAAENCEPLRLQIEANIASKGISGFTVRTVDVAADVPGQVVGQCGNGSKKIVYARSGGASASEPGLPPKTVSAPAVAKPKPPVTRTTRDEDIITECRDGSVSVGGRCKN
ncbi:MAG: DUF1161 domain-containing protein [Hydrogenophaga sp.]|jgi:hypothetical protein|nr:DUF1161 domain-containing protein [Hydrogenophaga sp.]